MAGARAGKGEHGLIPQEYIQEVVRRSDVTEVVSGYVQLRRRGRTQTGLCPFHSEKTPSFVVYPETQSFYCFGCGVGGDVITFIKRINNLDYVEAVKFLAGRAGMPMPEETDETGRLRGRILAANRDAARFFYQSLNADTPQAAAARAYWRGRGLSDGTIRRFGLGYAPAGYSACLRHLKGKGYTEDELLAAGLVKQSHRDNAKNSLYDAFYDRVMTPIFDLRGGIIGFGGRVLGDAKPKYVNSPETLVYKKSRAMFALNLAKKSASRRYILCEGYMDVISLHQAGFDTAVAACGTALTPEQVKLLSEYADEVVLCYDSDEAGQKATARSLGLFANSPVKVSVLNIPNAKDPDEFIKRFGAERFSQLLNGASNALEYKLSRVRANHDLASDAGRLDYIREAIGLLAGVVTPTERDVYAGRLAEETNVAKSAILSQLDGAVRQNARRAQRQKQRDILKEGAAAQIKLPYGAGERALAVVYAEQQLMAAVLREPAWVPLVKARVGPDDFIDPQMQKVCAAVFSLYEQGGPVNLPALGALLEEQQISQLGQLLARNADVALTQQDLELFLSRMEQSQPKSQKAAEMPVEELDEYIRSLRDRKG